MPLRVTWIAPKAKGLPDLAWLNELGRIENIKNVVITTRTGDQVHLDDVAALLATPADVMVWSGHGSPGGLILSDGKTLVQPRWLALQVALGTGPRVAVLAACGSQERDPDLRSLTEVMCRAGVDVVGFPALADDLAAGTFTVELIRALSLNAKVVDAFDVAMESISYGSTARGVFFTPGVRDIAFNLEAILRQMQASLDDLAGGNEWERPPELPPLRATVRQPVLGKEISSTPSRGHIRGLADSGPTPPTPTDAPSPEKAPTPAADAPASDTGGTSNAPTPT